nr:hypothetical protein [Tawny frogmouth aviadenovirus A]
MGENTFPWKGPQFMELDDVLPHLCLPPFRVKIRVVVQEPLQIMYTCQCQQGHSLMCRSLVTIMVTRWFNRMQTYLRELFARDPYPQFPVLNLCAPIDNFCHSVFIDPFNPLHALAVILSNPSVQRSLTIGRTRNGYVLYLQPNFLTSKVHRYLRMLDLSRTRLPFTLHIHCYPFLKITKHAIDSFV